MKVCERCAEVLCSGDFSSSEYWREERIRHFWFLHRTITFGNHTFTLICHIGKYNYLCECCKKQQIHAVYVEVTGD